MGGSNFTIWQPWGREDSERWYFCHILAKGEEKEEKWMMSSMDKGQQHTIDRSRAEGLSPFGVTLPEEQS